MVEKLFKFITKLTTNKPKTVLLGSIILTLIMGYFAAGLSLELSWVSLAPKGDPSVEEFQKIMNDFPSMNNILVIVNAEDENNLDEAVRLAEEKLTSLDKYVSSVTSKLDTEFFIENGLLMMNEETIEAMGYFLSDTNMGMFLSNLNKGLEMEIKSLEEKDLDNIDVKSEILENEDYLTSNIRGINYFYNSLNKMLYTDGNISELSEGINRLMLGDPYIRSIDGSSVLMSIQPNFDVMDYALLAPGVNSIIEELEKIEQQLTGVEYEITGMHVVGKDEMESIESDSSVTMIIGIVFILLLLYFAFRLFSAPILAFIPLIFGVIWDTGIAALVIGRLNLFTVFTTIMLIGLGIDFSIHLLSGYTEARSKGKSSVEAIEHTLLKIGPSIFTGAMTTAAAFLTLTISSLEVLSELGFVMGMGIITTVIAVFFVLPSILVLIKGKDHKMLSVRGEYRILGKMASFSHKNKIIVGVLIVLLAGFLGYRGSQNEFDLNMINLEPEGLESVEVMNKIIDDFGMSTEGIMIEKDSLEEIKQLTKELEQEETVSSVVSIADFLPSEDEQLIRLAKIDEVKQYLEYQANYQEINRDDLLKELKNYKSNTEKLSSIYERLGSEKVVYAISEILGKNFNKSNLQILIEEIESSKISDEKLIEVSNYFYNDLKALSKEMMTEDILTLSDLPDNYKMQFVSDDGTNFLLTMYPNFDIWENLSKEKGKEFIRMTRDKDPGFTGSVIFMQVLYESAKKEVVKVGILVLITLFLILFIHFRSIKYTLIAFTPLLFTLIFTVGSMELLGLKWNILNVLALPLIIGIGVDYGVHVLHRYTSTDDSISDVFSSVGRAILITTLTTMAGFGSLMFSSYRGMAYLGGVLFIGVGLAFIMTVLIIPILIKDRVRKTQA